MPELIRRDVLSTRIGLFDAENVSSDHEGEYRRRLGMAHAATASGTSLHEFVDPFGNRHVVAFDQNTGAIVAETV